MIKVGIVGISGYSGFTLLKLLLKHPNVRVTYVCANNTTGNLKDIWPSLKDQTNLIGTICLYRFSEDRKEAEVGYELLPDYHRKGIMSEALKAVLNFGFNELYLSEILAFTNKFNENSKSLLLKHQFILEEGRADEGFPENLVFSLRKNM